MLAAFRLLPIAWQLGIAGGLFAVVLGLAGTISVKIYNRGYQAALDDIAADNKEAVDAADQARARVRNCRASGGVWDASRGVCERRS